MMKTSELSQVTFEEADAFYLHNIAGTSVYALVSFGESYSMILTQEAALNLVQLVNEGTAAAEKYLSAKAFALPTVRALTEYEHRIFWLANFFGCAYSDIENHTFYNPMQEHARKHRVNFNAPSLDGLYINEDSTEIT